MISMDPRCHIELLSGLKVRQADQVITRFSTQKTATLLAYLAFYPRQRHPRELLIELVWPECALHAGRNRLNVALSSLRHQLEPPGVPAGSIIQADRFSVGLNENAITTDVAQLEVALEAAASAESTAEQVQWLTEAVERYRGPLLPGHYEDWITPEQQRLAGRFCQAVRQLIQLLEQRRDLSRAVQHAIHAVSVDPLREELHFELIRLYAAAGQHAAAQQQYRELERLLQDELGESPSSATRQLMEPMDGKAALRPIAYRQESAPVLSGARIAEGEPHLPTGTVTFLLTGIVDTSTLRERLGEAYPEMVASHHALLRREFSRCGGAVAREDEDTIVAAFTTAGHALAGAMAAQQVLASQPAPEDAAVGSIRMALHTGEVEVEPGGYRGQVLDQAVRILLTAHGGQILCSEVTAGLLRRRSPESDVRLTDLGVYRLPGVAAPEPLFQIDYPSMPRRSFPPLRAEPGHAGHLPLRLTRFFGRREELARLRELLLADEVRLMTLTGPGGSGKSRLAIEAARQLVEVWRDQVPVQCWFVPLVDLSDPALIIETIRRTLGLTSLPESVPLDQVVNVLSQQPSLLVLDNFEQLVDRGALVVRGLMERVPTLTCLVTSRQRLDLEGEHELEVLPLPVPGDRWTKPAAVDASAIELLPAALTTYASVQLFIDRAQTVRPDFQVTNNNAPAVAELCARLEGIPLAIELAAAQAKLLTPAQMLGQLEQRLDFLVSRRRDAATRHRTLRAAIDWSYQLIEPELQRFFARLSVFRGGWTVEAAERVCAEPQALARLAQLRECSLVLAEETPTGMLFRMLETLREFADQQLEVEEKAGLQRRHAEHFLGLAREVAPNIGPGFVEEGSERWLARLDVVLDNLRTAIGWASANEPSLALRLARALQWFWELRGHRNEARSILKDVLDQAPDTLIELKAAILEMAAEFARGQRGHSESNRLMEESLRLYRQCGNSERVAGVLGSLGIWAKEAGDPDRARALLEESLGISQELGQQVAVAFSLGELGRYEEGLPILRQAGDQFALAVWLNNMSIALTSKGEYKRARAMVEESLAIRRELGRATRYPLIHLAHVASFEGNYAEARLLLTEALHICRRVVDMRLIWECLEGLAEVAAGEKQYERAARLHGAAQAVRERMGTPQLSGFQQQKQQRLLTELRAAMGESAFSAAVAAGHALPWQQAVELALEE